MDNADSPQPSVITGSDMLRQAVLELVDETQRYLTIFSFDFENEIYSNREFVDGLSAVARGTRRAEVRILLHEPKQMLASQHQAVTLLQRLSSLIEARRLDSQYHDQRQCYIISDRQRMIYRPSSERYEALRINDGNRIREVNQHFEQMWQQSHIASELRRQML